MLIPRLLLADDDEAVREMLQAALERDGFEVVAVASVKDALSRIAEEKFDGLLSDLHMPRAGDGFTVVGAMRNTHPQAVTLVLSGYPFLDEALSAIRLHDRADLHRCTSTRRSATQARLHCGNDGRGVANFTGQYL